VETSVDPASAAVVEAVEVAVEVAALDVLNTREGRSHATRSILRRPMGAWTMNDLMERRRRLERRKKAETEEGILRPAMSVEGLQGSGLLEVKPRTGMEAPPTPADCVHQISAYRAT
jgi:hypothetical protein